jgi:hypothetical protein
MRSISAGPVDIRWTDSLPVYASEPFLRWDGDRFGWIGGKDESGRLVCVLPYSIIRKACLRLVRFRTATIPVAGALDVQEERSFLASVVEYFRRGGMDLIAPSGNTAVFRTYPEGAAAAAYGTIIRELNQPETEMLAAVRKSYRQNIRKAQAAGVQIKSGPEYLDAAYALTADTLRRSGAHFMDYRTFRRRVESAGEFVKIFVAEHGGIIQGCMVAPFSRHTAYNTYAGSKTEPVLGSMHLLHWEAMRRFSAMGVARFDFQGVRINPEKGSKQEGILTYKQGFGGTLLQGFAWKYPLRRLTAAVYSLAARWMLGGDIVDVEQARVVQGAATGVTCSDVR